MPRFARNACSHSLIAGCFFGCIATAQADVAIDKSTEWRPEIKIEGKITAADARKVLSYDKYLQKGIALVHLNSTGGDVNAAMTIGRFLRKNEAWTDIGLNRSPPLDGKCYSSCALIFISGVRRSMSADGELGLHRPYRSDLPKSRPDVETEVPKMYADIKSFTMEMGITDNFYQEMINTEPTKMVVYHGDDFTKVVPEVDPVYEEAEVSLNALRYGVTADEMRRRDLEAEKSCPRNQGLNELFACVEAIKFGLSRPVYDQRIKQTKSCEATAEDKAALTAVPFRLRYESPIVQKRYICVLKIMHDKE
jgi:hypothetical protein